MYIYIHLIYTFNIYIIYIYSFFKAVIIIMCDSFSKINKNTFFCCANIWQHFAAISQPFPLYIDIIKFSFIVQFFIFPGKSNGYCKRFYNRELPRQPAVVSLFVSCVGLSVLKDVKSDVNKDVSSTLIDVRIVRNFLSTNRTYLFCLQFLYVFPSRVVNGLDIKIYYRSCPSQLIVSSSVVMQEIIYCEQIR